MNRNEIVKKGFALLVLLLSLPYPVATAQRRPDYSGGSIRHRPGPPPRPHPRPPVRPGAGIAAGAAIAGHARRELYREMRDDIRDARRNRALFLGGLAVLGAISRSLPPKHTTVIVQGRTYYYAEGTYYMGSGGQYTVVAPPPGAVVTVIPSDSYVIVWRGVRYHYFNGVFYAPGPGGYVVSAPPPGVIVPGLPQGYVQNGSTYNYGGTQYREVLGPDGEPGFQVVGP